MNGNAKEKRMQWGRKKVCDKELKFGAKMQKKYFQKKFRHSRLELNDGNMYRKIGRHEKWKYVS